MARKRHQRHAAERLDQRYNESMPLEHKIPPEKLFRAVKRGRFEFLKKLTGTRSLCLASVDNKEVYFVYSKTTKQVVTVLSPDQAAKTRKACADRGFQEEK